MDSQTSSTGVNVEQVLGQVAGAVDAAQVAIQGAGGQFTGAGQAVKSIFQSKTFWFNIASAALAYTGYLPPQYAVPVNLIGNVLLRFLTNQAVTLSNPLQFKK